MGTPDPGEPSRGGGRPAELAEHPGVITTTVVSGIIAVAVAAAEWTGSGKGLVTPAGIMWSVVALLGVVAMLLGVGLELRRRRQLPPEVPAAGPAGRPGREPRRSPLAALPTGTVTFLFTDIEGSGQVRAVWTSRVNWRVSSTLAGLKREVSRPWQQASTWTTTAA